MKYILTTIIFFVSFSNFSQWVDDFTDGDFTNNPEWTGETANFIVNASNQLQLSAPAVESISYLSLPSNPIENATWEFLVQLDFNPSATNLARIYLVSNQANLKGSLNGYFVMVGNTADEVSLYRQNGTTITKIIDGVDGTVNSSFVSVRVRVTRDDIGNWELLIDNTGGSTFVSEGTVFDNTYISSQYLGVYCRYTATRSDKFFYDDFEVTGTPFIDNIPPQLVSVTHTSSTELTLVFDENLDQTTAETLTNYSVDNGIGNPTVATLDLMNPTIVYLEFTNDFINNTLHTITVQNVEDISGNSILTTNETFFYFISQTPEPFDVIITEFMADPSPIQALPEEEYVEIYNRSNKTFDIAGWRLLDAAGTSGPFPSYVLLPNQYVLIALNGTSILYGISNIIETNIPALNNGGDAIVLKNQDGIVLDSIYYTDGWYKDNAKKGGGWSIERKRLEAECSDQNNWAASVHPYGGTPGEVNSINTTEPDVTAPNVINYYLENETTIIVEFNEVMSDNFSPTATLSPAKNIFSIDLINDFTYQISTETIDEGVIYTLSLTNFGDCWGNITTTIQLEIGIPLIAESGDVVINEIMFNPLTGGSDYVEIVNISDKVLSLENWKFANLNSDTIGNLRVITNQPKLFLPGQYILVTPDTNDIIHDFPIYGVGTFIQATLPTYPNAAQTVFLLNENDSLIDFFAYSEKYHFKLISDKKGKSLERISFYGDSNNPDNWQTAAENVNWGTPGYKNSQNMDIVIDGEITIKPKIFSPDNDGYQDVLIINYQFEKGDNLFDIVIYDSQGRTIRNLYDNYFPGTEGFVVWDGLDDEDNKARIGSYLILITVFDIEGNRQVYKKVCVLAGNL